MLYTASCDGWETGNLHVGGVGDDLEGLIPAYVHRELQEFVLFGDWRGQGMILRLIALSTLNMIWVPFQTNVPVSNFLLDFLATSKRLPSAIYKEALSLTGGFAFGL